MLKAISTLLVSAVLAPVALLAASTLENNDYLLTVLNDGRVTVTEKEGGTSMTIDGEFTVMWTQRDPKLVRLPSHPNYLVAPRVAVRWLPDNESIADIMSWLERTDFRDSRGYDVTITQNGTDRRDWRYTNIRNGSVITVTNQTRTMETTRPFALGNPQVMTATAASVQGRAVEWTFNQGAVNLSARVELPSGNGDPRIVYTVNPVISGYVSVAYTGVPEVALDSTVAAWQETEAVSYQQFNFVMSEPDLRIPRVFLSSKNTTATWGLVVGAEECDFRLPGVNDSRFGMMLQMENGMIKPVVLAPLLGGTESWMEAGTPWSFSLYFIKKNQGWIESLEYAARVHHDFRDMRDNRGPGSINQAIERSMAFVANHNGKNYAMWDEQQKYHDYFVDKMWVFKPFSPLYGLSVGIIMDDEDFFYRRGLPSIEYALSRPNNLFAPYDTRNNGQANSAATTVGSPYIDYPQMIALHDLLQRKSPVLTALAANLTISNSKISHLLAQWQETGNASKLQTAKTRAMAAGGYSEKDFADLVEIAALTEDPDMVAKATYSAYSVMSQKINMYPFPTEGETITVDIGNQAPIHDHSKGRHKNVWGFPPPVNIAIPEQTVDTWRVARVGTQGIAYPIEYWMNLSSGLMRVAGLIGDDFLRDVARWGMVGRFGNYPGDNQSKTSLVSEANVIDNPPWMWNFATVNPGHAWDFSAQMMDFLVSDVYQRSEAAIDFPAVQAGEASFRVRIYGVGAGRFYDQEGVYLWVPRGMLTLNSQQVDWIGGWKDDYVYLALLNQSFEDVQVSGSMDANRVQYGVSASARSWVNNEQGSAVAVTNGSFSVTIPAKGIVALEIPATAKTQLQRKLYDPTATAMDENSYKSVVATVGTVSPNVHAMLLKSGGAGLRAYVYSDVLAENVITTRLRWKQGDGQWQEVMDNIYPYEYSIDLVEGGGDFACVFDFERIERHKNPSPIIVLSEQGTPATVARPTIPVFPDVEGDGLPDGFAGTLTLSNEFVTYMKAGANPDDFGLRDGKYYPYSTATGRKIAWKQDVWAKTQYQNGITPAVAEVRFRLLLAYAEQRVIDLLAARANPVDYHGLETKQKEILVDFMHSEGAINPVLVQVILARNYTRMKNDMLYVRWTGHTPDQYRNKAFAERWGLLN